MSTDRLPVEFQDLDGLVDEWAIATSGARADKRLTSTIETLRAFYDQLEPHAASALAYLQGITLEALTTTDATLLRLLLTLAEVSPAIEWYGRPDGAIGMDSRRLRLIVELGRV